MRVQGWSDLCTSAATVYTAVAHLYNQGCKDRVVVHHNRPSACEAAYQGHPCPNCCMHVHQFVRFPARRAEAAQHRRGVADSGQRCRHESYPEIPITIAGLNAPSLMIIQLSLVPRSMASSNTSWVITGSRLTRSTLSSGRPDVLGDAIAASAV